MRRAPEPFPVEANSRGEPTAFIWRGQRYVVSEINEQWKWSGKWWLAGIAQHRFYFRVLAAPENYPIRVFELYREGNDWTMVGVQD